MTKKQPFHKRKRITSKNQIGIAIVLGVLFCLMGYLGSYSANFVWEIQKAFPRFIWVSGGVALAAFLVLTGTILYVAKKYL